MAAILRELHSLPQGQATSWAHFEPESGTVEYTVGTYEDVTPGIFHKLTGVLSSRGMQILSAEIHTLDQGLVLDRFRVLDLDFEGPPPEDRLHEVKQSLASSLTGGAPVEPTFRRMWPPGRAIMGKPLKIVTLPTQVRLDNSTSDRYTIIDVFTHDRLGLLYCVTKTIFDLGLSVHLAKIGTHLDQVVDVFYVTDFQGNKVQDEAWLERIRTSILHALDSHEPA
jgi:[protein-PII] uridylyltransferase